jgi:hypothetical protein
VADRAFVSRMGWASTPPPLVKAKPVLIPEAPRFLDVREECRVPEPLVTAVVSSSVASCTNQACPQLLFVQWSLISHRCRPVNGRMPDSARVRTVASQKVSTFTGRHLQQF